jgi:hypothetical protein
MKRITTPAPGRLANSDSGSMTERAKRVANETGADSIWATVAPTAGSLARSVTIGPIRVSAAMAAKTPCQPQGVASAMAPAPEISSAPR